MPMLSTRVMLGGVVREIFIVLSEYFKIIQNFKKLDTNSKLIYLDILINFHINFNTFFFKKKKLIILYTM